MTKELDFDHDRLNVPDIYIKDVHVITRGGNGRKTACLALPGLWRLTRKDCIMYSVMIVSCGAWGALTFYDGDGRLLWSQPSAFTGSFVLEFFAKNGLIVDNGYRKDVATNITVNFKEAE